MVMAYLESPANPLHCSSGTTPQKRQQPQWEPCFPTTEALLIKKIFQEDRGFQVGFPNSMAKGQQIRILLISSLPSLKQSSLGSCRNAPIERE